MLIKQTFMVMVFLLPITAAYAKDGRMLPSAEVVAKYPLVAEEKSYCSSFLFGGGTLQEILMGSTYSFSCSASEKFYSNLSSVYANRSHYIDDVIDILSSNLENPDKISEKKRSKPLRIIHIMNPSELAKQTGIKGIGGLYNNLDNVFYFVAMNNSPRAFIHEGTHAAINSIFKNHVKPFHKSDVQNKNNYEASKLEVLKNIAGRLDVDVRNFTKAEDLYLALKTDSVLDLIYVTVAGKITPFLKRQIEHKYFAKEIVFDEDESHFLLAEKFKKIVTRFNLSADELQILKRFSGLLYAYTIDNFDQELIVLIPELLSMEEELSEKELARYFAPLMEYWDETIHNYAENIIF